MSNQTYELAKWVGDSLKARKYPFRVLYAPGERFAHANIDPVIIFERDNETSETVESPKGQQANAPKRATRRVPVRVRIYARANNQGARIVDHEELGDYLVDAVITALSEWSVVQKGGEIVYGEMAYFTPDELAADSLKPEGYKGLVYGMRFTIGRGVMARDYLKQARPTAVLTGTGSTVEVRRNDEDTPEVVPVGPQPEDP